MYSLNDFDQNSFKFKKIAFQFGQTRLLIIEDKLYLQKDGITKEIEQSVLDNLFDKAFDEINATTN